LRFGVFISKDSSNSFEYAGFQPSLELGFETVNDLAVLRRADSRKYQITYNISDAMVSDLKYKGSYQESPEFSRVIAKVGGKTFQSKQSVVS